MHFSYTQSATQCKNNNNIVQQNNKVHSDSFEKTLIYMKAAEENTNQKSRESELENKRQLSYKDKQGLSHE